MSRESQPYGLPQSASKFLHENACRSRECKWCGRSDGWVAKEIGIYGMFDELKLYEYELKDGRAAKEFIQYSEWWSGPMYWLGLNVNDGEVVFTWSAEAIAPSLYGYDRYPKETIAEVASRLDNPVGGFYA